MPKPVILAVDDEPTVLKRHPKGFILTGPDLLEDGKPPRDCPLRRAPYWLEASVPGIFVARGARFHSAKRVATAVGESSMEVRFVHHYLSGM